MQAFLGFVPAHAGAYEVVATDAHGRRLASTGPTHN